MFSKWNKASLATRLTLWYSGIFSLTSLLAFALIYVLLEAMLQNNTDEEIQGDMTELAALLQQGGVAALWTEVEDEIEAEGDDQVFFRLLDAQRRVVRSTDMTAWATLAEQQLDVLDTAALLELDSNNFSVPNIEYPISVNSARLNADYYMQLGLSLVSNAELLAVLRQIFLMTYPLLVICAALAGWMLGNKAMRGVELVTQTANAIAQGKIDDRVPYSNHGAEINRLTDTFNNMLDKVQLLLRGMREINDNIAHDLRSPLTRIRGQAEAILTSSEVTDPAVYDQVLALTIEESDRLINMINTMLDITETEAGLMQEGNSPVDISTLVHDACDLFQPLAFDQQIDFTYHAEPSITLKGNASFLQRLFSNLIDNALKYTQPGGRVSVSLQKMQDTIQFKVEDTGIGINQEDIDKIFKRFFRCDNSRSLPGNGLGLSLALAIARAHLGDILVSSNKNTGSSFTVIFPFQALNA